MADLRFSIKTPRQSLAATAEVIGEKRVKFVASTGGVDRHRTKLIASGCKTENFWKNPVFLWNHQRENPDDVIGSIESLTIDGDRIVVVVEFKTHRPDGTARELAYKAFQDVLGKILRAVSVGFKALKQSPEFRSQDEEDAYLDSSGVITVEEWELVEISLVPIGSNPDALIANRSFGLSSKLRVASVLCFNQSGKQLWGRRNDSRLYTTPGGKLSPGENPLTGACRELYEEAGVTVKPEQLRFLGMVDVPKARVFCYSVTLPDSVNVSGANDPDKEVINWEWLDACPRDEELHAKPNAITKWARSALVTSLRNYYAQMLNSGAESRTIHGEVRTLDASTILSKLGIVEGAKPEEISAALVKYLAGPDADADKQALVMGLLGMLTPAAPAAAEPAATPASAETPKSDPAEGMELALKAAQDEMAALRAENEELRKRAEADKPAEDKKPAMDDAEERADKACKAGQWPMSKRADLVKHYKDRKSVPLFAAGTFTTRGMVFTQGGNPVTASKPNLGTESTNKVREDVKGVFALASRRIAASTGVKQG